MRRVVAAGLVGLLLNACAISSAPLKPGEEVARHDECDRRARAGVPAYKDSYSDRPVLDLSGIPKGNDVFTRLFANPFVALAIVFLPPAAIACGVETAQERQKRYEYAYDSCMKAEPSERPSESPPVETPPATVVHDAPDTVDPRGPKGR